MVDSDWLRAFCTISQEQDFPQTLHLCRNTANNTNFHYRTNSVKFLTHFPNFWGKKCFSKKIWLCHSKLDRGFWHHAKNQENPNDQIPRKQPNRRQDRRLNRSYFIGPFRLLPGVQQVQLQ